MKDHKQKIYLFIYLLYFIMPWTQGSWTMKVVRTNDRHWMSLRPAADIRRQLVVCTHRANWWYYGKNFKPKFAEKINCHVKYGLRNQREQPGIWGTPPSSPPPHPWTSPIVEHEEGWKFIMNLNICRLQGAKERGEGSYYTLLLKVWEGSYNLLKALTNFGWFWSFCKTLSFFFFCLGSENLHFLKMCC
jgi:hypothetical protein